MMAEIPVEIARRASSIVAYDVPLTVPIARRASSGESPTTNEVVVGRQHGYNTGTPAA